MALTSMPILFARTESDSHSKSIAVIHNIQKNVWTGYLWPSDPEQLTPCPALYPGVIDPLIEGTRMVQASAITVMKLVLAVTFW
jgi:hypothetical protein